MGEYVHKPPPVDGGEGWLEPCGPYYGHLADLPLDELKAGEHLALKLRVKDGQVFGVSTTILGWNENPGVTSGYSPKHKGIYNPFMIIARHCRRDARPIFHL